MTRRRFQAFIQVFTVACISLAVSAPSFAQTLKDALAQAYESNPTLVSARANLRSVDELLPQAKSNWWRPTVTLNGKEGREYINQNDKKSASGASITSNDSTTTTTRSVGYDVTLPLYRGGQTAAEIKRARAEIAASQAELQASEQSVFINVVTAYGNVVLYRALVDINAENVRGLEKLVGEMEDMYAARRRTLIDLSLARDSLAKARAALATLKGERGAADSSFEALVGSAPATLEKWPRLPNLPKTREEALTLAHDRNPQLDAKREQITAGEANIRAYRGLLFPQVSLYHSFTRQFDKSRYTGQAIPYDQIDREDTWAVGVTVTVPLYQGGGYYSNVRKAKQDLSTTRADLDVTSRTIEDTVAAGWERLAASREAVQYHRARLSAAKTAEEGVYFQLRRGTATMQDYLNVVDRRLEAASSLESSQRDVVVETAALLRAIGQLTAKGLGLDVTPYDPSVHLHEVEDKLIGTGD